MGKLSALPADQVDRLQKLFVMWDRDGDGFVSKEEIEKMLCEFCDGDQLQSAVQQILAAADTNGDGRVDYDEFIRAQCQDPTLEVDLPRP